MTQGTLKTQGTELFLAETVLSSEPTVVKMACPTGITGLGGAATQLDQTCLDSVEQEFRQGLPAPGQVTVPFNFIPTQFSHQSLFDLKRDGSNLSWCIGFSDGIAAPTLDSNGEFETPVGPRTYAKFVAYVADVNLDIANNEIVRGTLLLQRSGEVDMQWPEV